MNKIIKILFTFIIIPNLVLQIESKPTNSILPVRNIPSSSALLEDSEERFLYLEKRNSNATFFQVLSSIPPAELNAERSKTFYYYENEDPPKHINNNKNASSTIEHQIKFSHQRKTQPIEVPESVKSTAIAATNNNNRIDSTNIPNTDTPKNSSIIQIESSVSTSLANTSKLDGPSSGTSSVVSIKPKSTKTEKSTPKPHSDLIPLTFKEPQAEINNSTINITSLNKKEAHLELDEPTQKEVNKDEVESISFRADAERSLGPDWNLLSPEDKKIRRIWGGTCKLEDWKKCSHIESWGGDYFVKDKKNPDKMILKHHEIKCFIGEERNKNYCLKNGWTVARCHLLCMSLCNTAYRNEYDKVVSHEGDCSLQFGR